MRAANKCRQRLRPEAPKNLQFVLMEDKLPANFCRVDVEVDQRRHLIFATDEQLDILSRARRWYMDATFWVVRKPFIQLLDVLFNYYM